MSPTTWVRNTSGLVAHAQKRREATLQRVEAVLTAMVHEGKTISFATVAAAADVTKTYLYSQTQIRARIEALRDSERAQPRRAPLAPAAGKTDASKDLLILAKEQRIHELEEEVRQLKKERNALLGQLYERL